MKIAIVGGSFHHWRHTPNAERIIKTICRDLLKDCELFISGGCGGVDSWAENVARELNIKCHVHKPEAKRWEDKDGRKGFKSRNKDIALESDELYCIEKIGRQHSGGLWTHEYAQKLGKKARVIWVG